MDFHTLRMQGLSIRKIAALRGVSRNAVRRALRSLQPPNDKRNRPKALKLVPYLDTISTWLADPVKSLWTGERMRRLLIGSAHYILGPFGSDCDLRRFGSLLAERGGKNAKKRAIVAVARKLAVLLHRLWVTAEIYDPLRASACTSN